MSGHGKKMVTPVIPVSRGSGVVTVARSAIGYDDEEEQEGSPIMSDSGYPLQGFSHKNWRDGLCNCCDCVDCGIWCMTYWCHFNQSRSSGNESRRRRPTLLCYLSSDSYGL